jgi:hypothetical protein
MNGIESGQSFRAALRSDKRLDSIDDDELDGLLEVRRALGACGDLVDRVVKHSGDSSR